MYKLFLALRYLRTRRISILSVLGVAFGVIAVLVVTSVMGGFARDLRARIRGMSAHVSVSKGSYNFDNDWKKTVEEIKQIGGNDIVGISPQVDWPVMIMVDRKAPRGAKIIGIDPALEKLTSGFAEHLLDDHPPDFSTPRKLNSEEIPCIIGSSVLGRPHENKDVVFISNGPGANASIADGIRLMNTLDKFAVLTADDEFESGLESGKRKLEAAEWVRGRADKVCPDIREQLAQAFELISYDPIGERRYSYVFVVSGEPVTAQAAREAWLALDAKDRARCRVMYGADTFEDEAAKPVRLPAEMYGIAPGTDFKDRMRSVVGTQLTKYALRITTFTPKAIKEKDISGQIRPAEARLVIVGVFNSGMGEYDAGNIYVPLEAAQRILGEPEGVNQIRIAVKDYDNVKQMKEKLEKGLSSKYIITTWEDEKSILLQAVAMERGLTGIMMFFIVLVAGFLIGATLSMMVTEKTRDIGITRAMGANVGGIMSIFLTEGIIIGTTGCALGVGLAMLILDNLNPLADWIYSKTGWYPFPKDVYLLDQIPSEINPALWALVIAATLVVCILSALYPAWKAARLVPVAALRYE